jgi:hypothetical protein
LLPKTKHPIFETILPSTGKPVAFRQMLVRDEKILLMAKASEEESDIYRAVKQVVNNCLFEVDIDTLTTFDIEFLFIKIRAISIDNIVELAFIDRGDEEEYEFRVDLDDVKVIFPEGIDTIIKTSEDTAIKLRYPPATLFDDEKASGTGNEVYEWIASRCIESIFDGDEIYKAEECSDDELLNYILDLDTKSYKKVKDFLSNLPKLEYIINYTNKEGTPRELALITLTDFFTLR